MFEGVEAAFGRSHEPAKGFVWLECVVLAELHANELRAALKLCRTCAETSAREASAHRGSHPGGERPPASAMESLTSRIPKNA